jgi:hypothetical protein
MMALEWLLVRDDRAGLPLVHGGRVRLLIFNKALSAGMPRVECVFEYQPREIVIHDLEFS